MLCSYATDIIGILLVALSVSLPCPALTRFFLSLTRGLSLPLISLGTHYKGRTFGGRFWFGWTARLETRDLCRDSRRAIGSPAQDLLQPTLDNPKTQLKRITPGSVP